MQGNAYDALDRIGRPGTHVNYTTSSTAQTSVTSHSISQGKSVKISVPSPLVASNSQP